MDKYNFKEYVKPETRGRPLRGYERKFTKVMYNYTLSLLVQVKARSEEEAKKKVTAMARKGYVYVSNIQKK